MNTKRALRSVVIAALYLVPIFPLIVISSFIVPYVTGQAFYFRILVEIAFAAWVILAMLDSRYRPKFTPLTITVSAFVALTLLADILGVDPLRSLWSNFDRMEGWITIIHLWALYMVMKSLFGSGEGKRLWHRWISSSLVVAFIVGIYGLFQVFGWADMHFDTVRIDASFGNPTFLAGYLLFHVFFAVYLLFDAWKRKPRPIFLIYAYAIAALLFVIDLFETGTRGALLGLIFGSVITLVTFSLWGPRANKKWRAICVGVIGLAIIVCGIFWLNRNNPYIQSNHTLSRFAAISWTASDQSRQFIWPLAVKGILERPILGWGQDNFNYLSEKHYDPAMFGVEQWIDRAHDIFLDQSANSGLIGLLSYLAIFIVLLIAIWRSSFALSEKCLIVGLLFGYILHNAFVFDTLATYIFFFAILALVDSQDSRKQKPWIERLSMSSDAVSYVILPIMVVALVAGVYYFNMRPILANLYLSEANGACSQPELGLASFKKAISVSTTMSSQYVLSLLISCTENVITDPSASGSLRQSFIDLSSNEIEAQITKTPNDAYVYYVSGPFLKNIGRFAEAESLLNKAHLLAPNEQVISFELASVYIFENKIDQAAAVLKQAYGLAPGYGKAASAYAISLMLAGHEADARNVIGADSGLLDKVKSYISSGQRSEATRVYQDLIVQTVGINSLIQQARIQYAAGNTAKAIEILRSIEYSHPEAKDQIEAAIKQVQH